MSLKSKAYLSLVLSGGLASLALHLPEFQTTDPFRFITYLAMALLASGMKVKLPQITGTMSVLFLFLLIGILELSLPEILVIAVVATFVQSFWRAGKTPKLVHIAFNIASLVIAVKASYFVYTAQFLLGYHVPVPWRLGAATFTFFVGNTMTVAVIVALTESKPILQTWRSYYFWSFPHYIIGACIAGLFSYLTRLVGWHISIFVLPVIFMIYRSYRLYLDRLEQERLHAEQQKTSANRLNSVLESTTDCVFAIDDAAHITYANTRARSRLFGGSEPVGTVVWEKFPHLASAGFREHVRQAIAERTAVHLEEFFPELKGWFEVHAYPSQEGVAFYLKEVTEERELIEQLRQAHKMEAVGRLAGGVAHDFNNLLTIILGYVQVAAHLLEKGHPARNSLSEVQKAGERAAALTQRLLAFSRKQVVQLETVDPNVIVAGMEGMLIRLIGEDVHISVVLDPAIGKVRADHNQLEQVVMNLAVNARDAMPTGGTLTLSTSTNFVDASVTKTHSGPAGLYSVISVRDTGHGMDAETKARIFEPFFTTKEQGKGTGLGLSMVYGIVQQSGGYITVQSEPGRGSVFSVHLPCVPDREEKTQAPEPESPHSGTGRILLVEDEQALRELVRTMLTEAGYTVLVMSSVQDALQLSRAELASLDLVITDVVMPDLSGPDLVAKLWERHPELSVLYISGYTDHPLIRGGKLSDTAAFLQKPFTRTQLLLKVQRSLDANCSPAAKL